MRARRSVSSLAFLTFIALLTCSPAQAQVVKMTAIPGRLLAQACQTLVDQKQNHLNYDDDDAKKFDVVVCRTYMRGYLDGLIASAQPSLANCFKGHAPALDDGQLAGAFLKAYSLHPADDAAAPLGDAVRSTYCPDSPSSGKGTKP